MTIKHWMALITIAACGLGLTGPAESQSYPTRYIRMVVPFPAGGLADVLARAVANSISGPLGQNVVIENQAGAGGNTGAAAVARAEPDGYTIMMSSAGILSINQFLYPTMPFDPERAFAPVTLVADMPMLMVVSQKTPARTVEEFLKAARAEPGKINFGSAGHGTTAHLALEMFKDAAQVDLRHVPYRGAAPAAQDAVAGQIEGVFDNPPTVISHIRSGSLRALAIAAKERMSLLPDVPTMAEAGIPRFEASSWFGVVAPAGTPAPVLTRLNAEIVKALRQPALQKTFDELGARLVGNTPEEFDRFIREERLKWGQIVKEAKVKLD